MEFHLKSDKFSENLVVFLHGYGADASNLEFLAKSWQAIFPYCDFMGIDAPIALEDGGFSWFDLESADWKGGVLRASNFVEEKLKDNSKKVFFAGFSQGAFLTSHLTLYSKLKVEGGIGFSGGIIPQQLAVKKSNLCLIHGDSDEVILPDWHSKSIEFASENGIDLSHKLIKGLGHQIGNEAFDFATKQLIEWFKPLSKNI